MPWQESNEHDRQQEGSRHRSRARRCHGTTRDEGGGREERRTSNSSDDDETQRTTRRKKPNASLVSKDAAERESLLFAAKSFPLTFSFARLCRLHIATHRHPSSFIPSSPRSRLLVRLLLSLALLKTTTTASV